MKKLNMNKKIKKVVINLGLTAYVVMAIQLDDTLIAHAEPTKSKLNQVSNRSEAEQPFVFESPNIVINEKSKQYKKIVTYVEQAESLKTGESIYLAQLLAEKLKGEEQSTILKRIDKIEKKDLINAHEDIVQAQYLVEIAEANSSKKKRLKEAEMAVNALYLSPERTELVERLHKIHLKRM